MTIDGSLRLLRRFLRFVIVLHVAMFPVILYSFGYLSIIVSCLLFIPCIQFNLMQGLYRMNKQYLYDLKVNTKAAPALILPSSPLSRVDSISIYTPLLRPDPIGTSPGTPHNEERGRKNYCSKVTQVITGYVRVHPIRFVFEILIVGLISYLVEHMTGGICLFKHGKMNIQHYTQHFYFLAGQELRMSTAFTRESALLPMNRAGNNLCTYGDEMGDICHLYINPDKQNLSNIFITLHLMNTLGNSLERAPEYDSVHFFYDEETSVSAYLSKNISG